MIFGVIIALGASAAPRGLQFAKMPDGYRPLKDAENNSFLCLFDAYNSSSFAFAPGVDSVAGCMAACDGSDGCTGIEFAAWREPPCALWFHGACSGPESPGFKAACPVDGIKAETYVKCSGYTCSEPAVAREVARRQLTDCEVHVHMCICAYNICA